MLLVAAGVHPSIIARRPRTVSSRARRRFVGQNRTNRGHLRTLLCAPELLYSMPGLHSDRLRHHSSIAVSSALRGEFGRRAAKLRRVCATGPGERARSLYASISADHIHDQERIEAADLPAEST